jgi:hypothetical protein
LSPLTTSSEPERLFVAYDLFWATMNKRAIENIPFIGIATQRARLSSSIDQADINGPEVTQLEAELGLH